MSPRVGGLTLYCKSKEAWKGADRTGRTKGKVVLYKYFQRNNAKQQQIRHPTCYRKREQRTEREKSLAMPSQGTCVPLSFKEARFPG